jgi:predicted dehydrogenase
MAKSNFRTTPEYTAQQVIGIGMLGSGRMARAHSLAYNRLRDTRWPPDILPRLVAVCGRNEAKLQAAAQRFGYAGYYFDWEDLIADPDVQVIDNSTQPYMHPAASIAALQAGKHVICEKPLAPTMEEARAMRDAALASGLVHMVGFNHRFVPALRLAQELIRKGALGDIHLFRAQYLQEFRRDPLLPAFPGLPEYRGRGSLNNIGSHIIDMSRFLIGEIAAVSGKALAHIGRRPSSTDLSRIVEVTDDDSFHFVAEFANGVTGVLEGSSVATGYKNYLAIEVNGSRGTVRFNLERMNELQVYTMDRETPEAMGFTDVLVTESNHPLIKHWWPRGHIIGWEANFVHELGHLLECVSAGRGVSPEGATFEDGYKAALIAEAVRESSRQGRRIEVGELE